VDAVDLPDAAADLHVHLSPPCTSLSKARAGSASATSVAAALDAVRRCVQLVLDKGFASWSLENVATPAVVACVAELARQHPDRVAHLTLDAADYGVGSNRVRLIASTPAVIRALKEMPVQRVSVAEALAAAGLSLPAEYLKSNTSNRDGTPCVRSTQQPTFTITASHPLIWCTRAGATVRCLTVAESAALRGFPPDWKLPLGSRAGLRAVGNAVPPPLARAVMSCAVAAARSAPPPAQEPAPPEPAPPVPLEHERRASNELAGLRRKLRRLTKRVDVLEGREQAVVED
jgi:site-specific DNA-cytosine methylase